MIVTRQHLVELCDKFLEEKIDKLAIQNFASAAIIDDNFDWDEDEIVSSTIFDWDNEEINFEINKKNISLWKKRLLTDKDDLVLHNVWNVHINEQKVICERNNSAWKPINKKLKIGVSTYLSKDPINGMRIAADRGTTGWFIWTGEFSENEDFFQPMCAEHLLEHRPEIIKYLALDIGFRFLTDKNEYEDIWHAPNL